MNPERQIDDSTHGSVNSLRAEAINRAVAAERERCAKAVSPAAVFDVLKKHFTAYDRLPAIAREISALISQ